MTKQASDRVFSFVLLGISIAFMSERKLKYPSNVLPNIVITILVIGALILLIRSFISIKLEQSDQESVNGKNKNGASKRGIFGLGIGSLLYLVIMNLIGFFSASLIYMTLIAYLLQFKSNRSNKKRFLGALLMSIITLFLIFLLFRIFLKVPTPRGFLI